MTTVLDKQLEESISDSLTHEVLCSRCRYGAVKGLPSFLVSVTDDAYVHGKKEVCDLLMRYRLAHPS